jgi:tRNA A-37 threonylcarbamoyl transferase component Bud32/tetratricopeptide (TPR) repeat protein
LVVSGLSDRLRTALADRYTIERELGRGGMAIVYLAEDLKHRRKVALKVLRPELAASLGAERFLREITTAAQLTHPNILPVHDSGDADGTLYYTMPYVDGESLRDRLNREKQLPIEDALQITKEVADALGYAHEQGIIHRDIKPENILFQGGHALVADFGIARAVSAAGAETLTETGLAVGTPAYMSPEQGVGSGELDGRSDLYSLGCVLYEMLSGDAPYMASTPQAVIAKKLSEPTPRISVVRTAIPPAVEAALERALAKTPADRYRTALEFVEALDTEAAPRRPRRLVAGATFVAVVVVVGGTLGWWLTRPAATVLDRTLVAVVPSENRTGDASLDYLSRLAAEHVVTYAQSEQVAGFVPLDAVEAAAAEAADGDLVSSVSAQTGARLVVTGSYFLLGDTLSFRAEVLDGETGRQTHVVKPVLASRDAIGTALEQLAQRVAVHLFVELGEPQFRLMSFQWGYPTLEVMRLCREGFALNVPGSYDTALARFLEAWELDTTWVLPLAWATGPLYNMGVSHAEADSATRIVYDKREQLSESGRLAIQSSVAMYDGDWETATQYRCQAFEAEPGRSWTNSGDCSFFAVISNRPRQALWAWEESARRQEVQPLELAGSLQSLWAVHAYHLLGDYEQELNVARRFLERAEPHDLPRAEYVRLRALVGLGRLEEVRRGVETLATMAVDDVDAVSRMRGLALQLRYHGHPQVGTGALQRAAELFERGLVEDATSVVARFIRSTIHYHLEGWDAAWRELRAVDTQARAEAIDDETEIWIKGYLGLTAARLGDAESVAQVEAWLRERDRTSRYLFGLAKGYLARIAAVQGRREEAVGTLRQAFKEGLPRWQEWGNEQQWPFDFEGIADYEPYQELTRPKG